MSQVTCIDAAFLSATVSLVAALASFQNVCAMHKQRKHGPVSNCLKGNACTSPMAMCQHSFVINPDPHKRMCLMIDDMYTHTNKFDAAADNANTARASDTVCAATVTKGISLSSAYTWPSSEGKPYLTSSLTGAP